MRAWRVHEPGEPTDVLVLEDVPTPTPGPGQVLIEVAASALNFADVLLCRGQYQVRPPLPFTPGSEVCGRVVALGAGAPPDLAGRRVIGVPAFGPGGFTECTVADAAMVHPIPDTLDDHRAAALHITYQTGHLALAHRARLAAGETLLVHAGAGGVGSAAIQLGRALGARVLATAGGPEKVAICRRLGAEVAIDARADDVVEVTKAVTDGRGADVIFDPVGGDTFDRSRRCVAFEGRILVIGFAGGRIPEIPANHVLLKNYSVVGVHWGLYHARAPAVVRRTHEALMRLHATGGIEPLVSRVIGLLQVPEALRDLASRGTHGKVVVDVRS